MNTNVADDDTLRQGSETTTRSLDERGEVPNSTAASSTLVDISAQAVPPPPPPPPPKSTSTTPATTATNSLSSLFTAIKSGTTLRPVPVGSIKDNSAAQAGQVIYAPSAHSKAVTAHERAQTQHEAQAHNDTGDSGSGSGSEVDWTAIDDGASEIGGPGREFRERIGGSLGGMLIPGRIGGEGWESGFGLTKQDDDEDGMEVFGRLAVQIARED
ncbi:hypothetical protein T440DRAFT_557646 [Plenodomus tracheiphilus IPT5]|uniref:Uncharacterized protein n=1 Tax=Plenodomus tracheiphilus IPT5 TaxID=1408161 RepID=A0A6A7AV49_9PLEO|nr:hypothetical protein T440DRAFT_557646 [Plenodomus tracheiphilus IPT5]